MSESASPVLRGRARRAAALFALSVAAASGCSASASHDTPTSVASTSSVQAQAQQVWNQFAACMRSHGVANFPDPAVNQNGEADFGSYAQQEKTDVTTGSAGPACEAILDHLPPSVVQSNQPVSASDLDALRQFAACMRSNGLADWPDPNADGSFPLRGTPLASEGKSPRVVRGMQACKRYWNKGINIS